MNGPVSEDHAVDTLGNSTPTATSTSGTLPPSKSPAWSMVVESRSAPQGIAAADSTPASRALNPRARIPTTAIAVLSIVVLALIAAILWLPRRVRS